MICRACQRDVDHSVLGLCSRCRVVGPTYDSDRFQAPNTGVVIRWGLGLLVAALSVVAVVTWLIFKAVWTLGPVMRPYMP